MENGVTKIRLDLWIILSAIFLILISTVLFLNAQQDKIIDTTVIQQKEVAERVTRIETHYEHIVEGLKNNNNAIEKLIDAVEKVNNNFRSHQLKTEKGTSGRER